MEQSTEVYILVSIQSVGYPLRIFQFSPTGNVCRVVSCIIVKKSLSLERKYLSVGLEKNGKIFGPSKNLRTIKKAH